MIKKILLVLIVISSLIGCNKGKKEKETVTISIAASLTDGIEEIAKNYTRDTGIEVRINLGGSGSLRKQMEEGAPVDFIFLASKDHIDQLAEKKIIDESKYLLKNSLVVIGNKKINNLKDILTNTEKPLAVGDPDFVPAGRYAREALVKLKLWKSFNDNILFTKDVRSALFYVKISEVDYSIVYKTDAFLLKDKEIYYIDTSLHSPIVYGSGVKVGSIPGKKFSNYLTKNIELFKKYGFKVR
ncbi:molybdate ABC transporter substrate-binding protein [Psychrilyobacter atlanticus]|uniref:molybdate ABC transporter substrate-binding protein n=1 Tax=Psychrilyobacter atlanticus TaxID=271091 RepID=UPI0004254377|nr:molybdate ABC transporter substrate-binding protein [Psychrilyobacter atlanticus]